MITLHNNAIETSGFTAAIQPHDELITASSETILAH